MKFLISIFSLCFSVTALPAQNGTTEIGARAAGLAYSTSTLNDSWCLFNNPGGLGYLMGTSTVFAFENRYGVEGLNIAAAGIATPLPVGTVGVSVFSFGDQLYSERSAAVSYGNRFGIASLGVSVNYLQYAIEGFGTKGIILINFGGIAEVTESIYFGAYIRNINQAQLAELQDERAPTLLNAGLSYRPGDKLILNIEAEKDINYKASLKTGFEYVFYKRFIVRTGIRTNPITNYFGFGFRTSALEIDYALTRDALLGNCHQAGVLYKIVKE